MWRTTCSSVWFLSIPDQIDSINGKLLLQTFYLTTQWINQRELQQTRKVRHCYRINLVGDAQKPNGTACPSSLIFNSGNVENDLQLLELNLMESNSEMAKSSLEKDNIKVLMLNKLLNA